MRKISRGSWAAPSERLKLAEQIRAELKANPKLSLAQLAQRTGASDDLIARIRRRWRDLAEVSS